MTNLSKICWSCIRKTTLLAIPTWLWMPNATLKSHWSSAVSVEKVISVCINTKILILECCISICLFFQPCKFVNYASARSSCRKLLKSFSNRLRKNIAQLMGVLNSSALRNSLKNTRLLTSLRIICETHVSSNSGMKSRARWWNAWRSSMTADFLLATMLLIKVL